MRSLLLTCAALPCLIAAVQDDAAFFAKQVKPVLDQRCIGCHGPEKQKGRLRLDSLEAVLKGGASGAAAVAGKPDESLLVTAIRYKDEDLQMPPKGKQLTADETAALVEWVKRGLPWPKDPEKPATP